VRIDLITSNPVDKVDRPKPQAFMASYYSAEEMEKLFEAAQGHKLELIIQLAAFYGLRRAEVMGLRWEAIDFEAKTLTIRHIVTSTRIDGKKILVEADRAKTHLAAGRPDCRTLKSRQRAAGIQPKNLRQLL